MGDESYDGAQPGPEPGPGPSPGSSSQAAGEEESWLPHIPLLDCDSECPHIDPNSGRCGSRCNQHTDHSGYHTCWNDHQWDKYGIDRTPGNPDEHRVPGYGGEP